MKKKLLSLLKLSRYFTQNTLKEKKDRDIPTIEGYHSGIQSEIYD